MVFSPLVSCLFQHARERPEARALMHGERWWSWRELATVVAANAQHPQLQRLAQQQPRARVATAFANDTSAIVGALTLQSLRLVEVPLGDQLGDDERERLARASAAQARLTSRDIRLSDASESDPHCVRALSERFHAQPIDPTEDNLILWTSGTSAAPRGVILSAGALAANAAGKLRAVPQQPTDRRLIVLPLWHAFARTCDFGTWLLSGCELAVSLGWQGLRERAPTVRPTVISMVPSLVTRLLCELQLHRQSGGGVQQLLRDRGLERLRLLGCGGAALPAEDFAAVTQLGICVIHGYGLTEAGPVVCSATPDDAVAGIVGKPVADTEIRLDAAGQLWARGPGLMNGYLDQPEATAAAIQDGWLRTGDLATIDEHGLVRILGRCDDTIVRSNGRKLQPLEVELLLRRSPGVRHAVVWQNSAGLLVAIVEPHFPTDSIQNLQSELAASLQSLPSWKRPERWVFLETPLDAGVFTLKGAPRRHVVGPKYAP